MGEMKNTLEDRAFFEQHTVRFKKSKSEEWEELQRKIGERSAKRIPMLYYVLGTAAVVLLALSLAFQFSAKTYKTLRGEQKICTLPDGSIIKLNAETQLTYNPLKWYVSRQVYLEGEAFFEVEKGSRFTVYSERGNTQVLGTSFNIYARNNAYKVSCVTGEVRVNVEGRYFNIESGESVLWDKEAKSLRETRKEQEALLAWQNRRLLFKAKPLRVVFDELERQYDVYIAYYPKEDVRSYSGKLSLDATFEENLSVICRSFSIEWEKSERKDKELYIIK